jgi:hypothetical protein
MFICEPTAREQKVGTEALVQHGIQVFFWISFLFSQREVE